MLRFAVGLSAFVGTMIAVSAGEPVVQPPDEIPGSDLIFAKEASLGLRHISLDGAPPVPSDGVRIVLHCTIGKNEGRMQDCTAACPCGDAGAPFVPAALKRADAVRVLETTRSGRSTAGARAAFEIFIVPSDKFENPTVDFSQGDRLTFTIEPNGSDFGQHYPRRALDRDVEAFIELGCVVRDDLGVECPDIRVYSARNDDTEIVDGFTRAAKTIADRFRAAPLTKDGKSAVGIGFRKRIRFKLM
ncbi:MAG: hypothetical protein ABL996_00655 [Micropepsaceae bacterium]